MRPLALLLACMLLAGCGEEEPAPRPKPAPRTPVPEPKPDPQKKVEPPPPATKVEPTVSDAEFETRLQAILALEQDAEFFEAMKLCRTARRDLKSHPRVRELDLVSNRLKEEKRAAAQMAYAVEQLKSDSLDVVAVASKRLVDAGDVGLIYLRKAVANQPDPIAQQTVKILAELRDERSLPLFIERLRRDPPAPLCTTLAAAILAVAKEEDAPKLLPLWPLVKGDQTFKHRELAGHFIGLLGDEGAPGRLPDLVGDDEAPAVLKAYVQRALKAEDGALAAWGGLHGPQVGLGGKGLRGQYYAGANFEKLILTRVDAGIFYTQDTFPLPKDKRENISIRWTGTVRIPEKGRYIFFVASDDGQRLWVNGKKLTDVWKSQGVTEHKGQLQLDAGAYPIKLEYYNGGGEAHIELLWKRPGKNTPKERIRAEFLRSPPVPDEAGE
ncbi:hypothetical protein HQ560_08065 [bacterium]|nr:hypothetical protein [bacterium]